MPLDYNAAVDEIQTLLKEKTKRYAFKKLEREVITTGACVECGSCVEGCPVNAISGTRVEDKYVPALTGECISCGICYAMCPRAFSIEEDLIGNVMSVWKVRSLGHHNHQDGGAVTTFLGYMLDKKIIEAAVVACQTPDTPWLPEAKRVVSKVELHDCGGTIYTHAPVVSEMIKGFKEGFSKQAIVGTACNIDAVERMESHVAGFFNVNADASIFKISLFCMESFNYSDLTNFLKSDGIRIEDVKRFAIAGGQFNVTIGNEEKSWPVKDLDSAAATSCAYCQDLTGMKSDLSCGNIGSDEGWTTVLVRTPKGDEVFRGALEAGLIEAEELEPKTIRTVANSARFKKNKFYKLTTQHE
jgi:coenzyme F420 hydrogenase subunit beta